MSSADLSREIEAMSSEAAPDEAARLQWDQGGRLCAPGRVDELDVPAGRVLVVDDDPLNRMLLTRSLEQEGRRVGSAASGQEALKILRRSRSTWCCSTSSCPSSTASLCSSD